MKKRLIIIGASGHGKVIVDIAEKMNCYTEIFFVDDNITKKCFMQYKCIGTREVLQNENRDTDVIVAIGNAKIRETIIEEVEKMGFNLPTLIHPNATIADNVTIQKGTVVMAGAVINSDSKVGKGVIINTASSVDHDCIIEDYVHISVGANIAGTVIIGKRSWIGVGATISNNLIVYENSIIGAGAVVINNIEPNITAVGCPARPIRRSDRNE